ncbi:LLM class flavin-dependent oxidoreductase [Gluconacetobacter aggeris]|uniref:LLM class flavin-dependent oxidoreductase n=1 Tax=Gluconacetobacter aggeris TaxID=1286186 RepID=A0A7W4IQU8_9PROT|nr:LLM class flavin-dependent oxidoreductase [Gluconacetobacter aggeris]MBB2167284.1 LLM class flavin-dependent oxidoreductase [Gluconacetobacter aggeris]
MSTQETPARRQLHVNLFEMACVGHIVHGMWRAPGNNRHRFSELSYWTEVAQLAERGLFDAVFLADVVGTYDRFGDGTAAALRQAVQIPNLDPLMLVPAMAAVTKHVGFGVTFSTTYEPPFAFARRMATLDVLTNGRVGWNIVTSYLQSAARNFGLEDEIPHDERYVIADEYIDVLYKLWEGSWDDDAIVADRAAGIFTDPSRVRAIDHHGAHFQVAGPHLVQPSRQRTPVLFQATGSAAGLEYAARHAEVVFIGGQTTEDVRRNIAATRRRAQAFGRRPDDIRFIVQAGIITGPTERAAQEKLRAYREFYSLEGALIHAQSEVDLRRYDPNDTIESVLKREGARFGNMGRRFRPEQTVGSALEQIGRFDEGRYFIAGEPGRVADAIESWLDVDGIDGINLRQYHSFDTARDFIDLIVPELQARGRYRTAYAPDETLRERLFGAGQARLPARHAAGRYRDPAALATPTPPLFPDLIQNKAS